MAEQLMDTLSNEEHERLLLTSEHAIASPLSPAAQAVYDATVTSFRKSAFASEAYGAAGVLRATANQINYKNEPGLTAFGGYCQARDQLLAIADELDPL